MYKLLIAIILSTSLSSFAQTRRANDFQRGYEAGQLSCAGEHLYTCRPDVNYEDPSKVPNVSALTRGQALLLLRQICFGGIFNRRMYSEDKKCIEAMDAGKVYCQEL